MRPQSGSITIMADDEPAAELLSCLREDLRELRVEVAEPDGHHVWVTDHSGSVASLADLLEERLDRCGQALGVSDWRDLRLRRSHDISANRRA
jgi:hypothetical protein